MQLNTKNFDFNRYINYCIVGYAFVLPISKAGITFFEIMMILLWLFEANFKYKIEEIKKSKIIIVLALFLAFSCIAILWSSDKLFALKYLQKYWHFLVIPVIYTSLNSKYIKHIFAGFFLGMLFTEIVSFGIFFELWQYKKATFSDPSPFMNYSNFSVFLSITSMILLNKIINDKNNKYIIMYILFLITTVVNLFIIGGRTGQITFFVTLVIIILSSFKNKIIAIAFSLLLSFLIFITAYNFSSTFENRANRAYQDVKLTLLENNDVYGSFGVRLSLWIIGTNVGYDNFLIGTGIGDENKDLKSYAEKYNFKRYMKPQIERHIDFHSTYVQYFAQLGIIGLLLVIILMYNLFIIKYKSKIYKNMNNIIFTTFFIFSIVGGILHIMVGMTLFSFFVGILSAISRIEHKSNKLDNKGNF